MSIDFTTDLGTVRLLISDVDESALTFSDAEVQAFLTLDGNDVRLAAATALETLASNEALVFKKIKAMRLMESDGPAVAASLMARAALLRTQSAQDGSFEIADGGCGVAELAEFPSYFPGILTDPVMGSDYGCGSGIAGAVDAEIDRLLG